MSHNVKDEAGKSYGRLTVISRAETPVAGKAAWLCRCSCGGQTVVTGDGLRAGKTKSCGCLRRESTGRVTHGRSNAGGRRPQDRTYKSWQEMKARCTNPSHVSYPNYGGRGISYVTRWERFENFLADMGDRPPGMTLDRKDPAKSYDPSNCRWATRTEQSRNKRGLQLVTFGGRTQCLAAWCEEIGLPYPRTYARLMSGHPLDVVLSPRRLR